MSQREGGGGGKEEGMMSSLVWFGAVSCGGGELPLGSGGCVYRYDEEVEGRRMEQNRDM